MTRNQIALRVLITTSMLPGLHGILAAHDGHGNQEEARRHYGQSAELGGGEIRTYVLLSKEKDEASGHKKPIEVGVEIPSAIMNKLPQEMRMLNFDFPIQARDTPIQFMMLDWNPTGHEPVGIYDRPHFDFHFYIQDFDEVMMIDPGNCSGLACDDFVRARKPVPTPFLPAGYIDQGMVAPMMGNHLVDPTAPEFHGKPFTRTFIYGSYDGQITFFEPMITNESLMRESRECTSVKLPQRY